jgi:hypothetical protein
MVTLHLGAWLAFGLFEWRGQPVRFAGLMILDWTCLIVIAGCAQTICVRIGRILRTLESRKAG